MKESNKHALKTILKFSIVVNILLGLILATVICIKYFSNNNATDLPLPQCCWKTSVIDAKNDSVCISCDYLGRTITANDTLYDKIVTTDCGQRLCCFRDSVIKNFVKAVSQSNKDNAGIIDRRLWESFDWWRKRRQASHLYLDAENPFSAENGVSAEMLVRFGEDDIRDLFTNFIDRFNVRQYIANTKANDSMSNSSIDICDDSSQDESMESETSDTCTTKVTTTVQLTKTSRSISEMLEKKGLRKKATKEQLCFTTLLRDAAIAAPIWQKAPRLSEIPARKRDAFFDRLHELAPYLKAEQCKIWKRLGEHLQNRRKYLLDKSLGKRHLKSKYNKEVKTKTSSPSEKQIVQSSGKEIRTKTRSRSKKQLIQSSQTMKISNTSSAKVRTKAIARSPSKKQLVQSNQTTQISNDSSLFPGDTVSIVHRGNILGSGIFLRKRDEMYAEVVLHTLANSSIDLSECELYEPTYSGACNLGEVQIREAFLWKIENLNIPGNSQKPQQKISTKKPESTANRYLPSSGKAESSSKGQKNNKTRNVASKKPQISRKPEVSNKPQNQHMSDREQSHESTTTSDADCMTEIVLMEWGNGDLYLGLLDTDTIQNCCKAIMKLVREKNTSVKMPKMIPAMFTPNPRDIQKNPDMRYMIWRVPNKFLEYNVKNGIIQVKNFEEFVSKLQDMVEQYV